MSVNATISAAPSATQLTTLEYLWTRVYPEDPSSTSYTQQIIVTTLVTFVLHELAYFGAYLPFFIADCFPSLRKYKIQPNKPATSMMQWNCLKQLFFSHVVIQLPMMIFAYPGFEFLGMKHTLPLPHWTTVAWKMIVSLFIEDFYHYWGHRFLHHDSIYKYVHKLHHEYTAPFGITAEYAHPIETMFLGIGTMLPPLLLLNHVFEMEVWLVVRLLQTVAAHSGYDFPFSLHNWVPFWGGNSLMLTTSALPSEQKVFKQQSTPPPPPPYQVPSSTTSTTTTSRATTRPRSASGTSSLAPTTTTTSSSREAAARSSRSLPPPLTTATTRRATNSA
eukprot:GEZU01007873.1.p1 GENE.GEZU01007873.1~~GEZU01007873.1.p1  ORF type:complete len:350 (-),score=58.87 GEZU01007873.1:326-1324(-)